jgi:hypothetical protein
MLERSYDGVQAYCQAKSAEIMLTIDRASELSGTRVTVNCVHPALSMPTKIVTHMFTPHSEIADEVRSTLRLITDPALENVSGRYFDKPKKPALLIKPTTTVPGRGSGSSPNSSPASAPTSTVGNAADTTFNLPCCSRAVGLHRAGAAGISSTGEPSSGSPRARRPARM